MDIVTLAFLLFGVLLLGALSFALPDRPLSYRVLAIFMGCFGALLATLTSIQLLSDTVINMSQTYTVGIYPFVYFPFLLIFVDGIIAITRLF